MSQEKPQYILRTQAPPKQLPAIETDLYSLEVFECDCGFHIGLDAAYLEQVNDIALPCPVCSGTISTKEGDTVPADPAQQGPYFAYRGDSKIPRGVTESAMHLIDGLITSNDMKSVLEIWDRGCLELYQSLIPYAEMCHQLSEKGYRENEGGPGVFDYEVSCEFGSWYGAQIITTGSEPTQNEAKAQLQQLNAKFWQQLND